jgi:hypothetical protein
LGPLGDLCLQRAATGEYDADHRGGKQLPDDHRARQRKHRDEVDPIRPRKKLTAVAHNASPTPTPAVASHSPSRTAPAPAKPAIPPPARPATLTASNGSAERRSSQARR